MLNKNKNVRVIKANKMLLAKVGTCSFDKEIIDKSQKVMDCFDAEFIPIAAQYLNELKLKIISVEKCSDKSRKDVEYLIAPIMQIKANATMLHYPVLGKMASITLTFLENLSCLDKDALDIVKAFRDTLALIVTNGLQENSINKGRELQTELKAACRRYYSQRLTI